MRDLGSPVHPKNLMYNVIAEFSEKACFVIVYMTGRALACSLIIGFKDILENPWSSSLKDFNKLSPNMLLYWSMLEYGCDKGYKCFDFGRSSPDEGTYSFKKQWGAKPVPLHWQYISLNKEDIIEPISSKSTFKFAARVWSKFPVSVTKIIGPRIRKYISL